MLSNNLLKDSDVSFSENFIERFDFDLVLELLRATTASQYGSKEVFPTPTPDEINNILCCVSRSISYYYPRGVDKLGAMAYKLCKGHYH